MTTQGEAAVDTEEALPVSDTLLVPLLDTAAAELAGGEPADLPSVLRPLAGFDRRGLSSGPARQQLRRALEADAAFRERVTRRFLERPEVSAALESWSAADALVRVDEAAERADLPLLASVLYAAQPNGWAFGLGIVCATTDRHRSEKERDDDANARDLQLRSADEARRRAEDARDAAKAETDRLDEQLRAERRARRERETRAEREVEDAHKRRREVEAALLRERSSTEEADARLAREAERAREAELRLRELRREVADKEREREQVESAIPRAEAQALAAMTDDARRLVSQLEALTRRVREPTTRGDTAPPPRATPTATRRVKPTCPPGMRADTSDALDAMLRTRGVLLVVDGYNVSMAGWGDAEPADQRERLVAALARLHLRLRCDVVVVFDGADVHGVLPTRRPGVRVVFSTAGEEADPVVVREAGRPGERTPVIVASSDRWVHDHAEAEGATVVPAAALLDVLRR